MTIKQRMPTKLGSDGKHYGNGYCTPTSMDTEQQFEFPPERVIPVIFLPGIMGSNLIAKPEPRPDFATPEKKKTIAWQPDDVNESKAIGLEGPRKRQLRLNPKTTTVDIYDPKAGPKGNPLVIATARTPLMDDDPITLNPRKDMFTKARERGWGEVFNSSYALLLNRLETRLNLPFKDRKLNPDWKDIIGVDPKKWGAVKDCKLQALTEQELMSTMVNCFYPVHAMGYNWLESNGASAQEVAKRIQALIDDYVAKGFQCEKVILVTHSMGGLVARALCHENYGMLNGKIFGVEKILGIVHGAMPAIGAAAGYRRIRAGFEGGGAADWVIGNEGPEVTAVLANSPGGLQLLPSEAYGKGWLRFVDQNGKELERLRLPKSGNPYEEIYKRADVWWGLLREKWINPAGAKKAGLKQTQEFLDEARDFHHDIRYTYHAVSYATYACDPEHRSFQNVVWELAQRNFPLEKFDTLQIAGDSQQGRLDLSEFMPVKIGLPFYGAHIRPPADAGDSTVPAYSADHQMESKKFAGVFRQTGYEHQSSYQDENALAATLYSIVRIAQKMVWNNAK